MSSIIYPLDLTKNVYETIKSSFSTKKFAKINTLSENTCIYDSFLLNTYKNYQEEEVKSKLRKIREDFITEFKGYITSESELSNQDTYNKVFQAYELIDMKDLYMLKSLEDSFDIFDIVIIRRDFDEEKDTIKGYKLFPERVKKHFSNVSKFFDLISLEFLKEIIEQRIIRKAHTDKIKKLRLKDKDSSEASELEEIINFMDRKENNLDLISLYNSLTLEDCEDQDMVLKMLSEIMDINIFLCRGWNSEITVLKDYHKTDKNPCIIIFKGEGRTSITGKNTKKFYEAGGVMTKDGIKTLIPGDDGAVSDLKKMMENDTDSYFLEKYNKYLKNIEQKSNLDDLDRYYGHTSESESSSDSEDEEEAENKIEEVEDRTEIPGFIRGYTIGELQTLLNLFVNPDYDYTDTDRKDMEIQYKNYLENIYEDDNLQ